SASGMFGAVPYIGHSTLPTSLPCRSATTNPAVRRRSIASELMWMDAIPGLKGFLRPRGKRFVNGSRIPATRPPYDYRCGCDRAAPPPPDRDDGRRQLDARPRRGPAFDRDQGVGGVARRRVLRLPLRRARRRARASGDARLERRGDDAEAADAARRRD